MLLYLNKDLKKINEKKKERKTKNKIILPYFNVKNIKKTQKWCYTCTLKHTNCKSNVLFKVLSTDKK